MFDDVINNRTQVCYRFTDGSVISVVMDRDRTEAWLLCHGTVMEAMKGVGSLETSPIGQWAYDPAVIHTDGLSDIEGWSAALHRVVDACSSILGPVVRVGPSPMSVGRDLNSEDC